MKTNKDQNSLQFMHDALLNKLMLEDYSPFPPKNEEPTIVNNQKEEKKKEDEQDKLIEEENEFLRSLHLINYLTFSPFGLSFFDENNKDNQNLGEEYLKEKEDKILHMIDFDYNNFEVTNDLLLNICQGFVDINKLKEENLTCNKTKNNPNNNTVNNNNNINNNNKKISNNNLVNDVGNIPIKEKKEEKDEDETDDEVYEDANRKRKIDFYSDLIKQFDEEISKVNKSEKKNFIKKWKNKFKDKDKEYEEYLKKIKEEERKKKQEEKKIKDMEKKKEKEKEEQIRTQNRLKKGFELIVQKAKKKGIISNSVSKIKKRPKSRWEEKESNKKSLNNSMVSNHRNIGNNSFLIKIGNKSLISTRRKKSSKSVKKNKIFYKNNY